MRSRIHDSGIIADLYGRKGRLRRAQAHPRWESTPAFYPYFTGFRHDKGFTWRNTPITKSYSVIDQTAVRARVFGCGSIGLRRCRARHRVAAYTYILIGKYLTGVHQAAWAANRPCEPKSTPSNL